MVIAMAFLSLYWLSFSSFSVILSAPINVLKILPLVLVLENRALGIVLNCVVYCSQLATYTSADVTGIFSLQLVCGIYDSIYTRA